MKNPFRQTVLKMGIVRFRDAVQGGSTAFCRLKPFIHRGLTRYKAVRRGTKKLVPPQALYPCGFEAVLAFEAVLTENIHNIRDLTR